MHEELQTGVLTAYVEGPFFGTASWNLARNENITNRPTGVEKTN